MLHRSKPSSHKNIVITPMCSVPTRAWAWSRARLAEAANKRRIMSLFPFARKDTGSAGRASPSRDSQHGILSGFEYCIRRRLLQSLLPVNSNEIDVRLFRDFRLSKNRGLSGGAEVKVTVRKLGPGLRMVGRRGLFRGDEFGGAVCSQERLENARRDVPYDRHADAIAADVVGVVVAGGKPEIVAQSHQPRGLSRR